MNTWVLVLLLSTGQTVQVNYPSQSACESKRAEYKEIMAQTTQYLNDSYFMLRSQKWTVENPYPREQNEQILKARYPKARADWTFQVNTANCMPG